MIELLRLPLEDDPDVVVARSRARSVAVTTGLPEQDAVRLAAAVSEVARNAATHGRGGVLTLAVDPRNRRFIAVVRDRGEGMADPRAVLERGPGLDAARRVVDDFEMVTAPGRGTSVRLIVTIPPAVEIQVDGAAVREAAAREGAGADLHDELFRENRELARALGDLEQLNRELEETNRGIVALHAELEQRAEELIRDRERRSRFFAFVSHELRTPLNAISGSTVLLAGGADGPVTPQQQSRLDVIRRSSATLVRLADDILDLVKAEAGKLEARLGMVDVEQMFGTMRGIFRALPRSEQVEVVIEPPRDVPAILSDEEKIAQILRNLVSNALKFTERGEVRLRAHRVPGDRIALECTDTGIGISREDQQKIFADFVQIDSEMQRRVRGTGLGLSVTRHLAELLGGHLELESEEGIGSTFRVVVPRVHPTAASALAQAGQ